MFYGFFSSKSTGVTWKLRQKWKDTGKIVISDPNNNFKCRVKVKQWFYNNKSQIKLYVFSILDGNKRKEKLSKIFQIKKKTETHLEWFYSFRCLIFQSPAALFPSQRRSVNLNDFKIADREPNIGHSQRSILMHNKQNVNILSLKPLWVNHTKPPQTACSPMWAGFEYVQFSEPVGYRAD